MLDVNNTDEPFLLQRIDNISHKPILSVGNFTSLDIECVIAGSSDRRLRFLDVDDLTEIASSTMEKKNVSFVAISEMSPDGDDPIIVTGGKDSIIQVWDPSADGINRTSITLPTTEVRSLAVYQGSKALAVIGTKDGKVFVWDLHENKEYQGFVGHTASVHCVCIANTSSDSDANDLDHLCIASGGADRVVRTWDIKTGKRVKKFRHQRSISSMIVTNQGVRPLLATAGVERMIKLWDLQTGVLLRTLTGHLDQINCISLWEGYEMLLISGSSDRTIRIFDMLTGECICVLVGHRDAVLSTTICDMENPKLVSSSEDLSLIQWDLKEIINRYYYTDGDLLGTRNKVLPYLPTIDYQAPEELDRKVLTKEERKKIRKERKKQQRMKNLLNDWNDSFKTSGKKNQMKESEVIHTNQEPEKTDEEIMSAKLEQELNEDDEEDDLQDDHIPGFEDLDEGDDIELDDLYQKEAEGDKEDGDYFPPETTQVEMKEIEVSPVVPSLRKSSIAVVGSIFGSALSKVLPMSEIEQENKNTSSSKPTSAQGSRRNSDSSAVITKQGSTSNLVKAMLGKLGLTATVAVEIPVDENKETIEPSTDSSKPVQDIERAKTPPPSTAASSSSGIRTSMSAPPTMEKDNYKVLAQQAQTKYKVAVVEHEIATDRQKKKAAAALQARLNARKNKNKADGETTDNPEKANDELMELKAEKLKQHKLQESRRRQSMAHAKARSANALQKRLEELANKRSSINNGASSKNQGNEITPIGEGDEESSEENSVK